MKLKLSIFILLTVIFAGQSSAQNKPKIFRGMIADKSVRVTLTRDGSKLSGTYFYSKIGKDLKLVGAIDAQGNFKLDEFAPDSAKTGELTGKWLDSVDKNGVSLEGEWINPKTKQNLGFYASEQMIDFSSSAKLISKFINENNKQKLFEITAEYPSLTGINSVSAAKFDQLVKDSVVKQVNGFRSDMMALTAEDLKYVKDLGVNNYLEISYDVAFANDNFVSLTFNNSTFTGGAHPNYNSFTVNYDLKNNKEIKLAELFKPNSNYLKMISAYSIKKLKKDLGEMSDAEQIVAGAGAKAENFKSWNITQKGILINFDPYQVASYAEGPQEVLIPYGELKTILREQTQQFITN